MKVIQTEELVENRESHKPALIKSWCMNPEEGALRQASQLASLPFIFKHVALMPDTHLGFGMPIGGVVALEGVVGPNLVGVDIGCGMVSSKSSLEGIEKAQLQKIVDQIKIRIPVGFSRHIEPNPFRMPSANGIRNPHSIVYEEYEDACYQVGTLGSGNHFIEIQEDEQGKIWIMIHSGSRNIGFKVAKHYNDLAKELNEKWFSTVPKEYDLAFLPLDTVEAKNYLEEMEFCLEFAKANRDFMLDVVQEILSGFTGCSFEESINIHHNYAATENHFGKNVVVHRKGATSAKEGEMGIIPGSQGSSSYIVRGKGNRESFMSCSHGAGRKMGREHAKRTLDLAEEQAKLEARGILHSVYGVGDLDEAEGSYKNIDVVMAEQRDLVDIAVKLEPMAVVKAPGEQSRRRKKNRGK